MSNFFLLLMKRTSKSKLAYAYSKEKNVKNQTKDIHSIINQTPILFWDTRYMVNWYLFVNTWMMYPWTMFLSRTSYSCVEDVIRSHWYDSLELNILARVHVMTCISSPVVCLPRYSTQALTFKPCLQIAVTIVEHVCDDASKRILKLSGYRLQIFLVKDQYLRPSHRYSD